MMEQDFQSLPLISPLLIEGQDTQALLMKLSQKSLCETQTLCGQCRSCKKTLKGFHPDWVQIDGTDALENLRTALLHLKRSPLEAPLKVFTIFNLGDSNIHFQNALLKTLEEPSSKWMIYLGTSSKWNLLSTIRSRCISLYKHQKNITTLGQVELEIYKDIQAKSDLDLYLKLESFFKDRSKCRELFKQLLLLASSEGYPGFWKYFAEYLDNALIELQRNLQARIVWDRAWIKASAHDI